MQNSSEAPFSHKSAQFWEELLGGLLEREVLEPGAAPAGALGFVWVGSSGAESRFAYRGVGPQSLFDLASVTKPVFALTVSELIHRGRLGWKTRLDELLPNLGATGQRTLEELLSHRANLVAHVELYREAIHGEPVERAEWLRRAATALRKDPDGAALYSDLGYLLAGAGIEAKLGAPLDSLVTENLCGPLGLELGSAGEFTQKRRTKDFVPTEWTPERGGDLVGIVHDDNAWYLSGTGLAGHAGLFGTLTGVTRLAELLLLDVLGRAKPFHGEVRSMIARRDTSSLRLGFDGVSVGGSSAGALASPETFGHLGFTGTSFWCDPERGAAVILLTNRVRPSRENLRLRAARPRIHDAIWAEFDRRP